ncbi:MAG: prepilin-type N-terminal cleavage/methylation domain-containing protein [Candidatus Paceibacterota bacterium]
MINLLPQDKFKKVMQSGFTMLEMLVVTAIVLVMSGVIIAYIPQFRDRSSLDLVAQEMALNIRSAQAFASGGRVGGSPLGFPNGVPSYGIFLTADEGVEENFFMFTDENNSGVYDEDTDQIFETYSLQGVMVKEFRINGGSSATSGNVYIVYTRPSLQAKICYNNDCAGETINQLEIVIQGLRSDVTRTIRVHFNGQISIVPTSSE